MKGEKLSWAICPRCKQEQLLVSELPTSTGKTCYTPGCCYWSYKYVAEEVNMKTGYIICDECKQPLVHPAMLDLKMRFRANVGIKDGGDGEPGRNPGITQGIMGLVEVEIEGDFCDAECLIKYAIRKANEKGGLNAVYNVRQDIFFRGDQFTPGRPKSEW